MPFKQHAMNDKKDNDLYFGGDGEVTQYSPVDIAICTTHRTSNWTTHTEYIDNKDGTVTCRQCPWGCKLPGYMRCWDGKIVDLRTLSGE